MSNEYNFHGSTTFIDKPSETIIQNFQNNYLTHDNSDKDKINTELIKLVKLVLTSKSISDVEKNETVEAIDSIASKVKEEKANKLTVKGTLQAIKDVVSKASDIAIPAMGIITTVMKLMGLG